MMNRAIIAPVGPSNGSQQKISTGPRVCPAVGSSSVAPMEEKYIQEVDKVREEMLAISRSTKFVESRDSMITDANGKIFAPGNRADKGVLEWIELVRKKIYDIAKKYNKPPREVLHQSQTMAKQSLDRSKRKPVGQSGTSSKRVLLSHESNDNQREDDVVVVAEMIKLNEGSSSIASGSQNSSNVDQDDRLKKEIYNSSQSQLSNIDQIINCIDVRVSKLRTCIADIQAGKSVEEAALKYGIVKEVVAYEIEHELNLGEISLADFQKAGIQPLKCLQYPIRLQEPEYWARLQSAVLSAAKKPLDTCLDTAKQHSIGLFHLLAALKEGFKKGRTRIEKEGQTAIVSNSSTNFSSHAASTPTVAIHPVTNLIDPASSIVGRKRDIRGAEVSSIATRIGQEVAQSFIENANSNNSIQIPTGPSNTDSSQSGCKPYDNLVNKQTNVNHEIIDAQKIPKRRSNDDIIVIEQKTQQSDMVNCAINSKSQEQNGSENPPQMVCEVCQIRFRNRKEYQSHVAAVCLDYDVL